MGEADEFQDTDPRSLGGETFTTDRINKVLDRQCDTTTNHDYKQECSNSNNRKQDTNCHVKNSLSLGDVDSSSNSSLDYKNNTLTTHIHHSLYKNIQNSNRLEQQTLAEGTVVSDHPTHEERGVSLFPGYDSSFQKNHNDKFNMQSATSDSSLLFKSGLETAIDEHQGTRKKCKFTDWTRRRLNFERIFHSCVSHVASCIACTASFLRKETYSYVYKFISLKTQEWVKVSGYFIGLCLLIIYTTLSVTLHPSSIFMCIGEMHNTNQQILPFYTILYHFIQSYTILYYTIPLWVRPYIRAVRRFVCQLVSQSVIVIEL